SRTLSQPLNRPNGATTEISWLCDQIWEANVTSAVFTDSTYFSKTCWTSFFSCSMSAARLHSGRSSDTLTTAINVAHVFVTSGSPYSIVNGLPLLGVLPQEGDEISMDSTDSRRNLHAIAVGPATF